MLVYRTGELMPGAANTLFKAVASLVWFRTGRWRRISV